MIDHNEISQVLRDMESLNPGDEIMYHCTFRNAHAMVYRKADGNIVECIYVAVQDAILLSDEFNRVNAPRLEEDRAFGPADITPCEHAPEFHYYWADGGEDESSVRISKSDIADLKHYYGLVDARIAAYMGTETVGGMCRRLTGAD